MEVFQCPACELKFARAGELEQHIRFDHPALGTEDMPIERLLEEAHKKRRKKPPTEPR